MPGYARPTSTVFSKEIVVAPSGNISATNLSDALVELDSEKSQINSPTFTGTVSLPLTTFLLGYNSSIEQQLNSKEKNILFQSSQPSFPENGELWVDNTSTATPIMKVYNGTSWISISSSSTDTYTDFLLMGC